MVNEDTLFVTQEEGLFDLTYSFVSPDGCPSEGTTVAQVVAVPEPEIATPNTETCWLAPTLLQSADDGVWIGEGINAEAPFGPHQDLHLPTRRRRRFVLCIRRSEVTFLPPSSNILTSLEGTSTPLCSDDPCPSRFLKYLEEIVTGSPWMRGLQGVSSFHIPTRRQLLHHGGRDR